MVKGLLGKKLNMGSTYDSHNRWSPITNVLIEPNLVVQVKEIDKDGYKAAQIGVGKEKHPTKSLIGHFKKATVLDAPKFLKEVPFDGELSLGQEIKVSDVFKKGEFVDVVGTSKGKGFAGVVKRHGFAGGPRTHGQSKYNIRNRLFKYLVDLLAVKWMHNTHIDYEIIEELDERTP